MSSGIFGIGLSALNAAQAGLLTTGHNISNAATPGYNRQEIVQSTALPQLTGSGYIGNGVDVASVKRVYSDFLGQQVIQAQAQSSQLDTYYTQLQQLDNTLGDSNAGLATALQDFFSATQNVASNPSSVPSRQAMLAASQSLVSRMQALDQACTELRSGVNSQVTASVSQINSYAQQIATLNQKIIAAESASAGQPANDLRDQRDNLVAQLNQQVSASVVKQSDGSYNVFIGSGQALVVGASALTLAAVPSPDDAGRTSVAYQDSSGNTQLIPDTSLQGGALGGYLAFRSGSLDATQNALGRIAVGLSQTFNAQHRLGQDLNGNAGKNYFSVPTPTVLANANNKPGAAASASITDVGALTTSDYRLAYDGTTYTLTRLSDGTQSTTTTTPSSGSPFTMDGVSVTSATLSAGDSFTIQPTRGAAQQLSVLIQNTSEIAAASPIQASAALSNTGTASISAGSVDPATTLNANLKDQVTITFHSPYDGQYDVKDTTTGATLASNKTYTDGGNISYNGWTVQVTGTPAAGDTFTVGPNLSNASADNRNALALAQLQTQDTLIGGTASYGDAYSQLVSDVGSKTRELQVTNDAQTQMLTQAQQSQGALSGVNMDEEAANLIRYQQSYQAAGKMLQIASQLFSTVLNVVGS